MFCFLIRNLGEKTSNKQIIISILDAFDYRESFCWINFDHSPYELLTVGGHKVRNMKHTFLNFFQKLAKIIIIEWQGTLKKEQMENVWLVNHDISVTRVSKSQCFDWTSEKQMPRVE